MEWEAFLARKDSELAEAVRLRQRDMVLGAWLSVIEFVTNTALTIGMESLQQDLETYSTYSEETGPHESPEPEAVPEGRPLKELDSGVVELCESAEGPCTMIGMRSLIEESLSASDPLSEGALLAETERRVKELEKTLPAEEGVTCIEQSGDCMIARITNRQNWTEREGDIYRTPKLERAQTGPESAGDPGAVQPVFPVLGVIEWIGAGAAFRWGAKIVGKGGLALKGWRAAVTAQASRHVVRHAKAANEKLFNAYRHTDEAGRLFPKLGKRLKPLVEQLKQWDDKVLNSRHIRHVKGTPRLTKTVQKKPLTLPSNMSQDELIALGRHVVCGGWSRNARFSLERP